MARSPRSGRWRPNVLVTGTSGTGKTTTCSLVARATQTRHINIYDFAVQNSLHDGWDDMFECYLIDDEMVCDALEDWMGEGGNIVDAASCTIYPVRWFDLVVVLQTDRLILTDRLSARGYSGTKMSNHIDDEILQSVLIYAKEMYDPEIVMAWKREYIEDISRNVAELTEWINEWEPPPINRKV